MINVELELKGKSLYLETGRFAKQADGSIIARYGDTVILATAVAKKEAREDIDFFPSLLIIRKRHMLQAKSPAVFLKGRADRVKKKSSHPA